MKQMEKEFKGDKIMARIFISYSHQSRDIVNLIAELLRKDHDITIDEIELGAGDQLNNTFKRLIQEADYTLLFLSIESMRSKAVSKEIYETIKLELRNKSVKLIPCLLEKTSQKDIPDFLRKAKIFERFYINLSREIDITKINEYIERHQNQAQHIFEDEQFFVLDIDREGLEIYLTGDTFNWGTNSSLKYVEAAGSYLQFGFKMEEGRQFKHFCLCDINEERDIRDYLISKNFIVTGSSDIDENTRKKRIWFLIDGYDTIGEGVFLNNVYRNQRAVEDIHNKESLDTKSINEIDLLEKDIKHKEEKIKNILKNEDLDNEEKLKQYNIFKKEKCDLEKELSTKKTS